MGPEVTRLFVGHGQHPAQALLGGHWHTQQGSRFHVAHEHIVAKAFPFHIAHCLRRSGGQRIRRQVARCGQAVHLLRGQASTPGRNGAQLAMLVGEQEHRARDIERLHDGVGDSRRDSLNVEGGRDSGAHPGEVRQLQQAALHALHKLQILDGARRLGGKRGHDLPAGGRESTPSGGEQDDGAYGLPPDVERTPEDTADSVLGQRLATCNRQAAAGVPDALAGAPGARVLGQLPEQRLRDAPTLDVQMLPGAQHHLPAVFGKENGAAHGGQDGRRRAAHRRKQLVHAESGGHGEIDLG